MATHRTRATVIGVLFFVAMASYLPGSEMIASAANRTDAAAGLDAGQVRLGVLLEFFNVAAVVGVGVLLFPVLRRYRESMALGYAATRMIEASMLLVSAVAMLAVLTVSQGAEALPALKTLSIGWYELAFQMAMIVLGLGSLALCYVLYVARLVPRPLAVLGFVGYAALFVSGWLAIFGHGSSAQLFYIPGAIFEILLPLWLIFKGFTNNPSPSAQPLSGT